MLASLSSFSKLAVSEAVKLPEEGIKGMTRTQTEQQVYTEGYVTEASSVAVKSFAVTTESVASPEKNIPEVLSSPPSQFAEADAKIQTEKDITSTTEQAENREEIDKISPGDKEATSLITNESSSDSKQITTTTEISENMSTEPLDSMPSDVAIKIPKGSPLDMSGVNVSTFIPSEETPESVARETIKLPADEASSTPLQVTGKLEIPTPLQITGELETSATTTMFTATEIPESETTRLNDKEYSKHEAEAIPISRTTEAHAPFLPRETESTQKGSDQTLPKNENYLGAAEENNKEELYGSGYDAIDEHNPRQDTTATNTIKDFVSFKVQTTKDDLIEHLISTNTEHVENKVDESEPEEPVFFKTTDTAKLPKFDQEGMLLSTDSTMSSFDQKETDFIEHVSSEPSKLSDIVTRTYQLDASVTPKPLEEITKLSDSNSSTDLNIHETATSYPISPQNVSNYNKNISYDYNEQSFSDVLNATVTGISALTSAASTLTNQSTFTTNHLKVLQDHETMNFTERFTFPPGGSENQTLEMANIPNVSAHGDKHFYVAEGEALSSDNFNWDNSKDIHNQTVSAERVTEYPEKTTRVNDTSMESGRNIYEFPDLFEESSGAFDQVNAVKDAILVDEKEQRRLNASKEGDDTSKFNSTTNVVESDDNATRNMESEAGSGEISNLHYTTTKDSFETADVTKQILELDETKAPKEMQAEPDKSGSFLQEEQNETNLSLTESTVKGLDYISLEGGWNESVLNTTGLQTSAPTLLEGEFMPVNTPKKTEIEQASQTVTSSVGVSLNDELEKKLSGSGGLAEAENENDLIATTEKLQQSTIEISRDTTISDLDESLSLRTVTVDAQNAEEAAAKDITSQPISTADEIPNVDIKSTQSNSTYEHNEESTMSIIRKVNELTTESSSLPTNEVNRAESESSGELDENSENVPTEKDAEAIDDYRDMDYGSGTIHDDNAIDSVDNFTLIELESPLKPGGSGEGDIRNEAYSASGELPSSGEFSGDDKISVEFEQENARWKNIATNLSVHQTEKPATVIEDGSGSGAIPLDFKDGEFNMENLTKTTNGSSFHESELDKQNKTIAHKLTHSIQELEPFNSSESDAMFNYSSGTRSQQETSSVAGVESDSSALKEGMLLFNQTHVNVSRTKGQDHSTDVPPKSVSKASSPPEFRYPSSENASSEDERREPLVTSVTKLGSDSYEDPFILSTANLANLDPEEEISFYIAALPICPYVYHCGVGRICSLVPCPVDMYCCKSRIGICCIPRNDNDVHKGMLNHMIRRTVYLPQRRRSHNQRIIKYPENVK